MWTALIDEDQMAVISKGEWDQIRKAIKDALTEHSSRKMERFKSWFPVGSMVALGIFILLQWNGYTVFRTRTEDTLSVIEKQLASLSTSAELSRPDIAKHIGQILQSRAAGSGAQLKLNLEVAGRLVEEAKKRGLKADPSSVGKAGEPFIPIAATSKDPSESALAWQVASKIMSYKSFLDSDAIQEIPSNPLAKQSVEIEFSIYVAENYGGWEARISKDLVDDKNTAKYQLLDAPSNPERLGPAYLILSPTKPDMPPVFSLDGHLIKNVIFRNVTIRYRGGPLMLKNVSFANCQFDVLLGPKGRQFSNAMLAANPVNFQPIG